MIGGIWKIRGQVRGSALPGSGDVMALVCQQLHNAQANAGAGPGYEVTSATKLLHLWFARGIAKDLDDARVRFDAILPGLS